MLAASLIPLLVFGLLAFAPQIASPSDEPDDVVDPDIEDPDGMGGEGEPDGEGEVDPDGEGEVDPDGEGEVDPDGEGEVDPDPANPDNTIFITDTEGNVNEIVVDGVDVAGGNPIDVVGSEDRDIFDSPDNLAVPVKLNGLGGDDALSFGFGTSADGGEGVDVLELTITQAALDNAETEAGVVTFNDPADAIAVEIDAAAEGFLHEIRVTSSDVVDGDTSSETVTLFYLLSPNETLEVDAQASIAAGRVIFEDGAQVLVEMDLGTETTTNGTDADGAPTQEVTGGINDDPTIMLNRDVTSSQTIDL